MRNAVTAVLVVLATMLGISAEALRHLRAQRDGDVWSRVTDRL